MRDKYERFHEDEGDRSKTLLNPSQFESPLNENALLLSLHCPHRICILSYWLFIHCFLIFNSSYASRRYSMQFIGSRHLDEKSNKEEVGVEVEDDPL